MKEPSKRSWVRTGLIWPKLSNSGARVVNFSLGYFYGAQQRAFDLLLGVSTKGIVITGSSMLNESGDCYDYQGCQWLSVRRALKNLNPDMSDVFVDLGSGKGRALLIAGRLPFKQIVGVEVDEALSRWATLNIERARPRLRAGKIECLSTNVLEWPVPNDMSVVFMFNPFAGQTFRTVMSRIFESYDRNPRALHLIYEYPWEHDWLLSTGRVVVTDVRPRRSPGRWRWWQHGDVIVTYQVVNPAEKAQLERPRSGKAFQRWSTPNGHNFTLTRPGSGEVITRF